MDRNEPQSSKAHDVKIRFKILNQSIYRVTFIANMADQRNAKLVMKMVTNHAI